MHLTRSVWVRTIVTAAVLVLLASRIDLGATAAALARPDPALTLLVVLLMMADRTLMIWRWIILLRARGAAISARSATWIYLESAFVGGYTAIAGDAARAYALARHLSQGSVAVASVAVDRLLGMLSIFAVALLGIGIAGSQIFQNAVAVFGASAVVLAAGAAAILLADRWVRTALPRVWHDSRPGAQILRLADALGAYRGHHAAVGIVAFLSIAVQLLRILQAYFLGRAIGIDVPFSYYLLFMPAGLIALMLPISLAGFGAPQGLIVWLLRPRGVPVADALALSTLIVVSGIVANLPGAWLYMLTARQDPSQPNNQETIR